MPSHLAHCGHHVVLNQFYRFNPVFDGLFGDGFSGFCVAFQNRIVKWFQILHVMKWIIRKFKPFSGIAAIFS